MHRRLPHLYDRDCRSPVAGMRRRRGPAGIALVQVVMAMAMIALCGAAGLRALIEMNRKAAAMRTLAQARAIVQRNIDSVLGLPFDSATTPAALAITTVDGADYDDDGGGDSRVNISVGRSGTGAVVRGTLKRFVFAESNPDSADIRRITFRLTYPFGSKTYRYEMTTLRARD